MLFCKHRRSLKANHLSACDYFWCGQLRSSQSNIFFVYCRQHSVPWDDGGGVPLGRLGRQGGKETVAPDMHVCQWILCLPFIICPGLWLLPLLSLIFWIWVSSSSFVHFTILCVNKTSLFAKAHYLMQKSSLCQEQENQTRQLLHS